MRISDWSSDVCSSDLAIGGFYHERLVGCAFEIVDDAGSRMAEREIVRRRFGGRIDGVEGERGIVLLQHLAPDQRERHADLRIIAFAFQIIAGDGNTRGVEAEERECAGLGKGEYVRDAVAPNEKTDAGCGEARI